MFKNPILLLIIILILIASYLINSSYTNRIAEDKLTFYQEIFKSCNFDAIFIDMKEIDPKYQNIHDKQIIEGLCTLLANVEANDFTKKSRLYDISLDLKIEDITLTFIKNFNDDKYYGIIQGGKGPLNVVGWDRNRIIDKLYSELKHIEPASNDKN
jgi:hypothetical protein